MLLFVLRKMLNNKWMVLCLLIGSILTAAMLSSIPLYTNGILQRMLTRDLQDFQKTSGRFPGFYYFKADFAGYLGDTPPETRLKDLENARKVATWFFSDIHVPAMVQTNNISMELEVQPEQQQEDKSQKRQFINLEALSGFQEHTKMVSGRMFSSKRENGVYEVVMSEQAMNGLDLSIDKVYTLADYMGKSKTDIKIKVVGVFTMKDPSDPFWFEGLWGYSSSLLMDYSLLTKELLVANPAVLSRSEWYYALDYNKITLFNMKHVLDKYQEQKMWLKNNGVMTDFKVDCIPILEQYYEREKQLRTTLWILQIPVILMLAFYIFMVSRLIIDYEKNEIAVLKSRGASRLQIFHSYLIESLILGFITVLTGPPLGMLLCKIMGSSNGFLEFVQRASLRISMRGSAYLYAVLAMLLFVITMLIPALMASRTTIVTHKQSKARGSKTALWHKFFFDVILLLFSGYGYYRYSVQKKTLAISGVKGTDLTIDPLLFLASTFFILGAGLLFLRLYPYIVRFIFWLGRKFWPPVLYASFIQVGRSGGQEQFLMLFIIFTLSIGIFNSNSARTINRGIEDRAAYEAGADMAIQTKWETDQQASMGSGDMEDASNMQVIGSSASVHYIEPYFMPYTQLTGVKSATKVFNKNNIALSMPTAKGKVTSAGNVRLMGIVPYEFGQIGWLRQGLLPHHMNQYLNLMTENRTAFLLSSSLKKKYELKEGDPVSISWSGQTNLNGVIFAFIDYWPTFNPNARKENDKSQTQEFVVANLPYIQDEMAMEPYEVWFKKLPGASSIDIYNEMKEKKLPEVTSFRDRASIMVERKNDPMLQGTNGSLTLGFIVTVMISAVGFLIYWILSIKGRLLQFGIFRAMGLTRSSVIGMLVCEQLLVSGMAVVTGISIGKMTSRLFIRLFEIVYSSEQQVLPFKVIEYWQDYARLYGVMGAVMLIGFAVLGTIVVKIKINQVIKLGED